MRWAVDRAALLQQELLAAYDGYQFHLIYQKLHNFCANDLGGFYLDIIKDRQYTTRARQPGAALRPDRPVPYCRGAGALGGAYPELYRRGNLGKPARGTRRSVFLVEWYQGLTELDESRELGRDFWQRVIEVRGAVNRELENQRNQGALRGGLDAEVVLYCDGRTVELAGGETGRRAAFCHHHLRGALVEPLADAPADAAVVPNWRVCGSWSPRARPRKCERCWHRRPDVGSATALTPPCAAAVWRTSTVRESGVTLPSEVESAIAYRRHLWWLLLSLAIVVLDQYTKGLADAQLNYGPGRLPSCPC